MNNERAEKTLKTLTEVEREYVNTQDPSDRRFKAALDISLATLDAKLSPILARLTALEETPRMQPGQGAGRGTTFNVEKFIDGLHQYLQKEFTPLFKRVDALEKSLEQIREKGIDYKGVFRESALYGKGDVVTHSGSMWIATRKTDGRPPGNGWTMCVKSGG
jgi:hypothetical protein